MFAVILRIAGQPSGVPEFDNIWDQSPAASFLAPRSTSGQILLALPSSRSVQGSMRRNVSNQGRWPPGTVSVLAEGPTPQ